MLYKLTLVATALLFSTSAVVAGPASLSSAKGANSLHRAESQLHASKKHHQHMQKSHAICCHASFNKASPMGGSK